ncbi:MAG: hypothetical protein AB7Q81_17550 [Gammaproteobacteria bacterium]
MGSTYRDMHMVGRRGPNGVLAALLGLGLICGATAAQAVSVAATARLDWSQFQVDFLTAAGTLLEDGSDVYAAMYGTGGFFLGSDDDYGSDWVTPLDAIVSFDDGTSQATVSAESDGTQVRAHLTFTSPLPGEVFDQGYSYGYAEHYGVIEVTTGGTLLISVPYTVAAETDNANVAAYAWVSLNASRESALGVYANSNSYAQAYAELGYAPTPSDAGTLALALVVSAGDTVYFNAQSEVDAYAYALVPLPPALGLLGGGLLVLRRRRC